MIKSDKENRISGYESVASKRGDIAGFRTLWRDMESHLDGYDAVAFKNGVIAGIMMSNVTCVAESMSTYP